MKARRDPRPFMEGGGAFARDQGAIRAGRAFRQYGEIGDKRRKMRDFALQGGGYPQGARRHLIIFWVTSCRGTERVTARI
jgi:hypothetical protein